MILYINTPRALSLAFKSIGLCDMALLPFSISLMFSPSFTGSSAVSASRFPRAPPLGYEVPHFVHTLPGALIPSHELYL